MVIVKHRGVTAGQKIDAMESKSDGEGGVHAKQLQKEQRRGRRQLVHGKPLCFAPTVTTWEPSCNGGHQPTNTTFNMECLVFKHTHGQFGSQVPQLCCMLPK